MTIKIIDEIFSVCKVLDYKCIDLATPFVFTGSTDEEKSIVCPVRLVPVIPTSPCNHTVFAFVGVVTVAEHNFVSEMLSDVAERQIRFFSVRFPNVVVSNSVFISFPFPIYDG